MHGFAQVRDEGGFEFWLEPIDVVASWTRRSSLLERARSKSRPQLQAAP